MKQRIGAYLIDAIHRAGVDKIFVFLVILISLF